MYKVKGIGMYKVRNQKSCPTRPDHPLFLILIPEIKRSNLYKIRTYKVFRSIEQRYDLDQTPKISNIFSTSYRLLEGVCYKLNFKSWGIYQKLKEF